MNRGNQFALLKTFNRVESRHWWWEGRRYLLRSQLQSKKPKAILDIGCGTGETLTFLRKLFPKAKLFGIDISNDAVAYAKKRGHKQITNADARAIPYKKEVFDAILLLDVLEHIKEDKKVLLEVKRVLAPNGIIVVTSPALPFLWSDHDRNQGHFRRYTKEDFIKLAKRADLKINKSLYFNFFLSPIVIFVRLLGKINFFRFLVRYDNGINYEVAHHPRINAILSAIFNLELWLLAKGIQYPLGVSLVVTMRKEK